MHKKTIHRKEVRFSASLVLVLPRGMPAHLPDYGEDTFIGQAVNIALSI